MDFLLSPLDLHSCKILSQCEAVLKLQLGCLKRQYVTFLMRKYSRVSSVQITESLDTLRHILLTSMSFFHPTIWCIVGKLSYHSQQQVWSLLLARDSWSKVLSLVWKLCGLTEAQCGVVHGVYSFGLLGSGCDKWSFTTKNYVYCVGTSVTLYPLWHTCGSPTVCTCCNQPRSVVQISD
jgi:hypothetical protein